MTQIPVDVNGALLMAAIQTEVSSALVEALKVVEEECRKTVPIDQGELRDSIHREGPVWFGPFYAEGRVVAGSKDIPQAHYQEFGTVAHGPVKAKAMHFFWKGEEIFAKWVRGCTPLRWMSRATELALPLVEKVFKALETKIFKGWIVTYTVKGPTQ